MPPIGLVAYPMRCVHRHRPYLPGPAASSRARGRRPRHALGVRRRHSDWYVHEDLVAIGRIGCFLRLVCSLTGFKHAGTRTGDTSGGLTSDGCEHASAESCAMLYRRLIIVALLRAMPHHVGMQAAECECKPPYVVIFDGVFISVRPDVIREK